MAAEAFSVSSSVLSLGGQQPHNHPKPEAFGFLCLKFKEWNVCTTERVRVKWGLGEPYYRERTKAELLYSGKVCPTPREWDPIELRCLQVTRGLVDGGRTEDEQVSPVSIPGVEVLAVWVTASVWLPGKEYSSGGKRGRPPSWRLQPLAMAQSDTVGLGTCGVFGVWQAQSYGHSQSITSL